ncbi:IS4/Tn5 family transposase DNA-binding protein [Nitrococcus mobilis]|uniref:Transposase Tn5-like N-terminal domain-containing protein n=1 Tax=Nitrococcus mobilis Nb-231 TaxID=314278 RepID=A4BUW6_9GAMM|nr:hypothetical protein NB231_07000 [Nitrococcus mobilis Nb-231]
MGWVAAEFEGIDLGDRRLDSRVVLLLERLADKPAASIPGVCNGWGETQAAYRFFAQEIGAPAGAKPIEWRLLTTENRHVFLPVSKHSENSCKNQVSWSRLIPLPNHR